MSDHLNTRRCRYCRTTVNVTHCGLIGSYGGWLCDGDTCNENAEEEIRLRDEEERNRCHCEEEDRW